MIRRLIIRAEAESDIAEAALWYDGHAQGMGDAFLSEVHTASNVWLKTRLRIGGCVGTPKCVAC